jgi:hypothetical protein
LSAKRVYSHERPPAPVSFDPNLLAPGVGADFSSNIDVAAPPSGDGDDDSNVVTAAEQEAQEGRGSIN